MIQVDRKRLSINIQLIIHYQTNKGIYGFYALLSNKEVIQKLNARIYQLNFKTDMA